MEILNFVNSFSIFGLDIKFYGIIIGLGMLLGIIVAMKNAKFRNISSDDIITLALFVLPLAVIGARLYYVIFSSNSYTFWEIFAIWEGGLAIYGGVIGGAIGVALFCIIKKKNFFDIADIAVPSLILGQAIGRWGNFFNQEAFGYEVLNKSLQWFPFSVYIESTGTWHLATFFYESMLNFAIFVGLFFLLRKVKIRGITMCSYFILYGFVRFFIEGLRTDSLYIGPLRVSQLLSLLLVIGFGVLFTILLILDRKKRIKQNQSETKK